MTTTVDPNYWSLLGVSPECDSNELKSAFRKEARKWHPDLNKNDVNASKKWVQPSALISQGIGKSIFPTANICF